MGKGNAVMGSLRLTRRLPSAGSNNIQRAEPFAGNTTYGGVMRHGGTKQNGWLSPQRHRQAVQRKFNDWHLSVTSEPAEGIYFE